MPQQQDKQWTILELLRWTTDYFQQKEVENPKLTAEVLLAHTLNADRMHLYVHFEQPLQKKERDRFKTLIRQRVQGIPTQYLTGKQEFWSLEFQVAPGVLIPRPETEHLVEAAIKVAAQFSQPAILDIGTGSGIIAICLKKELPAANISASDLSDDALTIARYNTETLLKNGSMIHFQQGDIFEPFKDRSFDMIVSNPPYISAGDYKTLAQEIRAHEPQIALYAGEEGLDIYHRLIPEARTYLRPGGYVLVEIGYGQKESVVGIFQQEGFVIKDTIKDYAGIERVVIAKI